MAETAEQARIRQAVARLADRSIERIGEMLRLGLLLPEERPVPGGIGIGPTYVETWTDHRRSLERIDTLLISLRRRLGEGPVPEDWYGDAGGTIVLLGYPDPISRELHLFFTHYLADLSLDLPIGVLQHLLVIGPEWTNRAHMLGVWVWVPDPSRPESVLRLEPTVGPRGPVLDLWRDEQGRVFYVSHGRRQYVVDTEGQFPAPAPRVRR